jgi:hypothetical protein
VRVIKNTEQTWRTLLSKLPTIGVVWVVREQLIKIGTCLFRNISVEVKSVGRLAGIEL